VTTSPGQAAFRAIVRQPNSGNVRLGVKWSHTQILPARLARAVDTDAAAAWAIPNEIPGLNIGHRGRANQIEIGEHCPYMNHARDIQLSSEQAGAPPRADRPAGRSGLFEECSKHRSKWSCA